MYACTVGFLKLSAFNIIIPCSVEVPRCREQVYTVGCDEGDV